MKRLRDNGHYWIKILHLDWIVATWMEDVTYVSDGWYIPGVDEVLKGYKVLEIDEEKLTRD